MALLGHETEPEAYLGLSTRRMLSDELLHKVRNVLTLRAHTSEDMEDSAEKDLHLGRCSIHLFQQLTTEKKRKGHGIKFKLEEGFLFAQEITSAPHGGASASIAGLFWEQDGPNHYLTCFVDLDMRSQIPGQRTLYESDVVVKIPGWGIQVQNFKEYPAIIIEIGVSQQLSDLCGLAAYYLGAACPTVEYYVALKRWDFRSDGTQQMLALVWDRNHGLAPVRGISFGSTNLHSSTIRSLQGWVQILEGVGFNGPACDRFGVYRIAFPLARIFNRLPSGVPAGAPENYYLDLYPVHLMFRKPVD